MLIALPPLFVFVSFIFYLQNIYYVIRRCVYKAFMILAIYSIKFLAGPAYRKVLQHFYSMFLSSLNRISIRNYFNKVFWTIFIFSRRLNILLLLGSFSVIYPRVPILIQTAALAIFYENKVLSTNFFSYNILERFSIENLLHERNYNSGWSC